VLIIRGFCGFSSGFASLFGSQLGLLALPDWQSRWSDTRIEKPGRARAKERGLPPAFAGGF
jgi:hypothetical protein